MKIVTAPHPSLRKKAQHIIQVDEQLIKFVEDLQSTLKNKKNPPGVGLAATQVNQNLRVFASFLPSNQEKKSNRILKIYLNPIITKKSSQQTFGPDPEEPTLEGCLSIPTIYGPVLRWKWIDMEYEIINQHQKLEKKQERLYWYDARVAQHEIDHLDGILFTDYLLKHDIPAYQQQQDRMIEVNKSILEIL